jgi:hypothetical protein
MSTPEPAELIPPKTRPMFGSDNCFTTCPAPTVAMEAGCFSLPTIARLKSYEDIGAASDFRAVSTHWTHQKRACDGGSKAAGVVEVVAIIGRCQSDAVGRVSFVQKRGGPVHGVMRMTAYLSGPPGASLGSG